MLISVVISENSLVQTFSRDKVSNEQFLIAFTARLETKASQYRDTWSVATLQLLYMTRAE